MFDSLPSTFSPNQISLSISPLKNNESIILLVKSEFHKKNNFLPNSPCPQNPYRPFVPIEDFLLREEIETLRQLHLPGATRNRQTQVPKRVEGNGAMTAQGTLQRRLELTYEHVYDFAVIVTQVALPCLHHLLVISETKKINLVLKMFFD